ncbi:uncharacterized protein SCO4629-like isoform X1 [Pleurodeles waltl]|uniref:uncharacterized protein SCO4629-like isoform X1 n=1 Tax=Pleurodeles waltl TaxID=8319 RepID=UPI00370938BD
MDADTRRWAGTLWNYLHLGHHLEQSDVIICLGCHDVRVAERAAALFLKGWAPWILFTGYQGHHTIGVWGRPEAEVFSDIAMKLGVPETKIILEKRATNTGENIRFSWQILNEKNIPAKRVILVQQPFMERRVLATFLQQWPGDKENTRALVASPELSIEQYPNESVGSMADLIGYMLGVGKLLLVPELGLQPHTDTVLGSTVERIREYPSKGFQIEQSIPAEVLEAYSELRHIGYQSK